ncbi:MAG TPA: decarboxylating 6-phosphogluconate dehydrogenase [Candidatus Saccharimonadia bacterium]|jgi:6-phosphogluconate dehydrogenase
MKIGFIGLGRMGGNMVGRLVKAGHEVVVTGRNPEHVAQAASETGASAAADYKTLVGDLGPDPIVWLMIPSDVIENEMAKIIDLMPKGGIIVDGGNSDYRETKRRAALAAERGVTLVDAGTSGGILGATAGYCIMVGGDKAAIDRLAPLFQALAQPGGWAHMGPAGSGHYVKMIHNAIEYGMMESLAEGFNLLKTGHDYPDLNLAQIAAIWQHGSVVESLLNRLTGEALRANPNLEGIDGFVAETGEARWTLETAASQDLPMPAIQAAMDVRLASQQGHTNFGTKLLAAMRHGFGGHAINKS